MYYFWKHRGPLNGQHVTGNAIDNIPVVLLGFVWVAEDKVAVTQGQIAA